MITTPVIERTYTIDYAHRVLGHKGKCGRLHGHTGVVNIRVTRDVLNDLGMVIDFADLDDLVRPILSAFDHTAFLRKTDPLAALMHEAGEVFTDLHANPTSENLAALLLAGLREQVSRYNLSMGASLRILSLTFAETPRSRATVE